MANYLAPDVKNLIEVYQRNAFVCALKGHGHVDEPHVPVDGEYLGQGEKVISLHYSKFCLIRCVLKLHHFNRKLAQVERPHVTTFIQSNLSVVIVEVEEWVGEVAPVNVSQEHGIMPPDVSAVFPYFNQTVVYDVVGIEQVFRSFCRFKFT